MASEETPLLLPTPTESRPHDEAIYDRFSPRRKRMILAMVSWCGLIPLLISGSFVPLIPQIADDLESTGTIVSLAISLSIFAASIGTLIGGSYSTYYGRRPIYLCGLTLMCMGSLGVAMARTIPTLIFCRFFQVFGASPGMSVGAGVIGDIYVREQRGFAMGVFLAAKLLGPALAPLAGGLAAHYASWRVMQLALFASGFLAFLIMYLSFPETTHPNTRGIDKAKMDSFATASTSNLKLINPFKSLTLLRSPVLAGVAISTFLVLLTDFTILTPMAYTVGMRYHIENKALLGACFLPNGLGDIVGAPLAGRISDRILIRSRKRGGAWYPEDRLRGTLVVAATIVPLSVLFFGLIVQFIQGKTGLVLSLICLFFNGVGVQMVLGPSSTYLIDIMPSRNAETVAVNNATRSFMLSIAVAGTLPMINWIGIAPTYAVTAVLAWVGYGMLCYIVRYGNHLRAWNDVGFATSASH